MKVKRITAVLLTLTIVFALLAGCAADPSEQILGKWMDSAKLNGYEFKEGGRVTIYFLGENFNLLNLVDGTIDGSYTIDKENEKISITYTLLATSKTETYKYEFGENQVTFTDDDGKATSYFKAETTTDK